ncbi:GrpB domain protein [Cordyceps fumosorosea ARSEF 2679]|uniref:GrpB domain protein n=1 Tax=Cordyceps fumosorosea (strain ARSEF 2679) TaxID=1081104 RepID=A0A167NCV7_CORFA|nr:GrpB domain protein [Cordyceps fumosorosea ARSEF 2679]OAA55408.1 GrpB domain protein [Cordyceps fumosorosea ARSEF 2679]
MEKGIKAFEHQEWVSQRKVPHTIDVVDPDPSWPSTFSSLSSSLRATLPPSSIIAIHHVGSTAVPGLAAKPVLDVDLILARPADESTYVPFLEAAGWHFLFRQPPWYEHRLFAQYHPVFVNLHVYGPGELELESRRHRALRDWLRKTPADRELYARAKREASARAKVNDEGVGEYTEYKGDAIREIMARAEADAATQVQSCDGTS